MHVNKARELLLALRELVIANESHEFYGHRKDAFRDIDSLLSAANLGTETDKIKLLLAPTGNLQELSIECGWGDEFLRLAEELEGELEA